MDKKHLPLILAVVAISAIAAAGVWWFGFNKPPQQQATEEPEVQEHGFEEANFFATFDANRDGTVTREEFSSGYALWPGRFTAGPGKPALSADEAFARLDQNSDGKIDTADHALAASQGWVQFKIDCAGRGLEARIWKGKWLALNGSQVSTFNFESGAARRGEVPLGGAFFDSKYFDAERWVSVISADGTTHQGLALEVEGRLRLLTPEATLMVFKPSDVTISEQPDSPYLEYIRAVRKTRFDDVPANLALAHRCRQLGLLREAGMMFARVLVFEPGNTEALDALNLRRDGEKFVPRG